jgi:NADH:ubiquinone oxidoreductase subunit 2 (subunit N)
MVVTGGIWAATQPHLGRIMAYGSVAETGFALLALSLIQDRHSNFCFCLPARASGWRSGRWL